MVHNILKEFYYVCHTIWLIHFWNHPWRKKCWIKLYSDHIKISHSKDIYYFKLINKKLFKKFLPSLYLQNLVWRREILTVLYDIILWPQIVTCHPLKKCSKVALILRENKIFKSSFHICFSVAWNLSKRKCFYIFKRSTKSKWDSSSMYQQFLL